jgi:rubrerythrin
MTTPVAQRPNVDQRSAHEAGKREAAPQEQAVSNGEDPTAGMVGRGRDHMPPMHYSFRCYSCGRGWERQCPTSDCPRCGTTNNYCAADAARRLTFELSADSGK